MPKHSLHPPHYPKEDVVMSDFVVTVTSFMIFNGQKKVTTQDLAKIKRIANKAGPNGAVSTIGVMYEGGDVENWEATTMAPSDDVLVQTVGTGEFFNLKERGRTLYLEAE